MRFKAFIPLFMSLPFCIGATRAKVPFTFISNNFLYKVTGDKEETIEFYLQCTKAANYTVEVKIYNNKTNALLYSGNRTSMVSSKGITMSFNLPIRYKLTGDGLRFSFSASSNQLALSRSGVLYPYLKKSINALQYRNSTYNAENCFLKLEKENLITDESFGFYDYNEFISKSKNNTIDFSSVKMQYLMDYDFRYEKVEYHIKDYNNIYPNLYRENNEVVLNMNCISNNSELSFELDDELYVNPETLEMSSTRYKKYVKTDSLYIPIGKQSLLEENDSYIIIKEAGYSANDIILPLTYYFSKPLLGLCYNSEYCIEGGVKQ